MDRDVLLDLVVGILATAFGAAIAPANPVAGSCLIIYGLLTLFPLLFETYADVTEQYSLQVSLFKFLLLIVGVVDLYLW